MVLVKAVIIAVLATYLTTETLAQTTQRAERVGEKWAVNSGNDERPKMRTTSKSPTVPRTTTARPGTDCGRNKIDQVATHVSNGKEAAVGEFPWHAALYIRDGNKYLQLCAGTLVTNNLVLTAAHCFFSESAKKIQPASLYKVALGKHLRSWDEDEAAKSRIQRSGVREISIPPRYKGRDGQFQYDIAVVLLSKAVKITDFVDIICMDWDSSSKSLQLVDGSVGRVAGWGATATESSSNELQYVDLPVVSEQKCRAGVRDRDVKDNYYTADKFCAGFQHQNTSVCKGDSGGGLIFQNASTQSYYLRGIVSVSLELSKVKGQCANQFYTGFTDVAYYIQDLIQPALFKFFA